ncbi:DUF1684 domain-containing protein [Psychroserpens sp.]|uniref:DUF1684 domain-containing protein n=1 Tax=Psychroserpens sp. TaxID=2020870 RepID=UPI001B070976|nr:DUF1684 domain-containing protein [Psychroserpens sp.]MBO6607608.1 DUF1684 domain-containing protein [Psychroserpens sp.]MBO6631050.1 DUF1684 domain-containing protein [Psychroserpens sp.]MBO6655080.1 DUF1684 domain-containing protein [Psychroserpens sp.]MBO6683115.1 DUF1684 domain-containing protein [Psychroserpens sp.]MBO6749706.1 DUF1684 domain-containing protein [Psychroserpens sp.]
MKHIFILFLLVSALSCAQEKRPIAGETEFQREMNADFKDATKSPLKDKDRKKFKGLDFFKFDSTYVVKAAFVRTPEERVFKMKTTTDRLPEYVKYGILTFELDGKSYQLNVYQNQNLINKPGFENYLFLPFLDNTNGDSSYGGGRYIEMRIPESESVIIDFNTAYNPYCAYNEKYSCPIVPRENYLDLDIRAGVKAFKKH